MSSGLVQLAAVWCAGEPAEEGAVGANTRRRDHITPVLRRLHWLPVQRRVEFKIACLVHQSLALTAPTYLSADIHLASDHGQKIAISVHLHTDHSLFHGREGHSATEASLSQDRACGTVCRLL